MNSIEAQWLLYVTPRSTFNKKDNLISRRVRVTIVTVEKAISITYSLALVIQHVMRLRRIIICGLSGCTIFFHII